MYGRSFRCQVFVTFIAFFTMALSSDQRTLHFLVSWYMPKSFDLNKFKSERKKMRGATPSLVTSPPDHERAPSPKF